MSVEHQHFSVVDFLGLVLFRMQWTTISEVSWTKSLSLHSPNLLSSIRLRRHCLREATVYSLPLHISKIPLRSLLLLED